MQDLFCNLNNREGIVKNRPDFDHIAIGKMRSGRPFYTDKMTYFSQKENPANLGHPAQTSGIEPVTIPRFSLCVRPINIWSSLGS